jgi:anaerobic magnesium-protoporphyrin IX monomethyl ester cyclase
MRKAGSLPRIVLVKPPERSAFNFGAYSLGTLAAAVDGLAEVSILDGTVLPLRSAVDRALAARAGVIGVTVMSCASVAAAARFLRRLRPAASRPRPLIVCGGHGASCRPDPLIDAGADVVVVGEGETTFRRIVEDGFRPAMAGTICRRRGRRVAGPPQELIAPLDALPLPRRDLMPSPPDGVHLMETSRGCPHACAFCETTRFYGRRWRAKTPARAAFEAGRLVEDFGARIIQFADDNFAASPGRVVRLCAELGKGPLPVFFMAAARADDLMARQDVLPSMASARILRINVGVETLDAAASCRAGKSIAFDLYREAFRRLTEERIFSVASFIVGLPGESEEARDRAVEMAVEAGPAAAVFVPFIPFPGIPLAGERAGLRSRPRDERSARDMTAAFYAHPAVRSRLKDMAGKGGVIGLLAQGTLARRGAD